jgi:two-component system LytT family response regulator
MALKVFILDDEINFVYALSELLMKTNYDIEVVGKASSVKPAIEQVNAIKPDLVFLDVEMPVKNGFDFLNEIVQPEFKVIFITGHSEHAIKAIKYSALDFILKPISLTNLNEALKRVTNIIDSENMRINNLIAHLKQEDVNSLIISSTNQLTRINYGDILFAQAHSGNYSEFHLLDGRVVVATKPLNFYETLLSTKTFFRIHRSYLVNLFKVKVYHHNLGILKLENEAELPISTRKRSKFALRLKSLG